MIGDRTLERLIKKLKQRLGNQFRKERTPQRRKFIFGIGKSTSHEKITLTVLIGDVITPITMSVIRNSDLPMLISNSSLRKLGAIWDTGNSRVFFVESEVELDLLETSGGHMLFSLLGDHARLKSDLIDFAKRSEDNQTMYNFISFGDEVQPEEAKLALKKFYKIVNDLPNKAYLNLEKQDEPLEALNVLIKQNEEWNTLFPDTVISEAKAYRYKPCNCKPKRGADYIIMCNQAGEIKIITLDPEMQESCKYTSLAKKLDKKNEYSLHWIISSKSILRSENNIESQTNETEDVSEEEMVEENFNQLIEEILYLEQDPIKVSTQTIFIGETANENQPEVEMPEEDLGDLARRRIKDLIHPFKDLTEKQLQSKLMKLHIQLGHIEKGRMQQIMRWAKVPSTVVKQAGKIKCRSCVQAQRLSGRDIPKTAATTLAHKGIYL